MRDRMRKAKRDRFVTEAQIASDNFNNDHPVLANQIGASAFTSFLDMMEMLASRIVALEAQIHEEEK